MNLGRRLHGILGTALTWAAASGALVLGLLMFSMLALKTGNPVPWRVIGRSAFGWSLLGFFSGAMYAGLLILLERKRTVSQLSSSRTSVWGIVAGALAPMIPCAVLLANGVMPGGWPAVAALCAGGASVGLVTAQLTLRAARRGPDALLTRGVSPVSASKNQ